MSCGYSPVSHFSEPLHCGLKPKVGPSRTWLSRARWPVGVHPGSSPCPSRLGHLTILSSAPRASISLSSSSWGFHPSAIPQGLRDVGRRREGSRQGRSLQGRAGPAQSQGTFRPIWLLRRRVGRGPRRQGQGTSVGPFSTSLSCCAHLPRNQYPVPNMTPGPQWGQGGLPGVQ